MLGVALWMPPGAHPPSPGVRARTPADDPLAAQAAEAALRGEWWSAMELNSELVERAMGYPYATLRETMRRAGATASGTTGLGPAFAVVARRNGWRRSSRRSRGVGRAAGVTIHFGSGTGRRRRGMSVVRLRPGPVSGTVRAPPSKSYTHRALVVAHLSRRMYRVENPLVSDDTVRTAGALRALGSRVEADRDGWSISRTRPHLDRAEPASIAESPARRFGSLRPWRR